MGIIMDVVRFFIDFIIHVDQHLITIADKLGIWAYVILFLVIFCETGLVFTPFLPGDSFLFAVGTMAAIGVWDLGLVIFLLIVAAILGDASNYYIGSLLGDKIKSKGKVMFLNMDQLDKAQQFYIKNGAKAIILARFIPIVRTFAPFVAGMSRMPYNKFVRFNVLGALIWVPLFTLAGYFFGRIPFIANNIGLIGVAIILISVIPIFVEFIKSKRGK